MHLYKTSNGTVLHFEDQYYLSNDNWDALINQADLYSYLLQALNGFEPLSESTAHDHINEFLLPPVGTQEVWAAGVTYLRSLDARKDEAKDAGAADCYQRVYEAERPELFFKSLPHKVVGHGGKVNIRRDSQWNVPEPELTLFINSAGKIQAYTIGNDMSSRSIEGENPLYLPQAKMYQNSASVGPCLYVLKDRISPQTEIRLAIYRSGISMYEGNTPISRIKRSLDELADYLFRESDFPTGAFLMTGTCLVPPDNFTLQEGDEVAISIDGIGTLHNIVAVRKNT